MPRIARFLVPLVPLLLSACATMSPSDRHDANDPATVVQRQLDAYNRRDLDAFVATYADDTKVYRMPTTEPTLSGKHELAEFYRTARFNQPALHAELVHRSVLGGTVVDHERITGLRADPLEAVAVYAVEDGLIRTVWLFTAK